jgi:Na+/H+ antiporter NhaD/arsenite permease-like protein
VRYFIALRSCVYQLSHHSLGSAHLHIWIIRPGGTATLIGDPPNIMIGSYAKLSFVDFIINPSLVNVIGLAITVVYFLYWYKNDY